MVAAGWSGTDEIWLYEKVNYDLKANDILLLMLNCNKKNIEPYFRNKYIKALLIILVLERLLMVRLATMI